MYLKSIEVQGFKSFAHKNIFEFHNGITAIVGPNGSGKSNVADAVRWVLGEQRIKQLRGGSMQDVIFSGTENRKPLSYASVAITLDNSDHQLPIEYEEVTVARKLYRSGESEYLINGRTCRLKDVNELFYDTGIGKEGYSIIGQGQIEKILSGKPEERRELFDEAAGIVKFKRRKNMSLKKLEDERQNLLRVSDILKELERQKGPLEKQSETAKEYLRKKEELRLYDINMFLLETERLKEQMKETEEKLNLTEEELKTARNSYDDMKAEYEAVEDQADEIEDRIEGYKRKLNETSLLKQQLENQIALLKEQIHSAHKTDDHFEQRYLTIEEEIKSRKLQMEKLTDEESEIIRQAQKDRRLENEAREKLVDIQTQAAALSVRTEKNKNDIIDLLNARASTKVKNQRYDTMLEQIQSRKEEIRQKLQDLSEELSGESEKSQKYELDLKKVSERISASAQEEKVLGERIEKIQDKLSRQEEELKIGQSAYHREQSRLESVKNLTERYEGYGISIRKVMEQKSREPGILGVVADIIRVDKRYETAIETALGGSIQNIVTEDEATAKRMIAFLKKHRFGRATFLPLTNIGKNRGAQKPEALCEDGVVGLANALVESDGRYQALVDHLLGRTIVVENIDCGAQIARKYKYSLRLVTVEGELLNPGGSMTGGAFKNSSNLLSRRREIEELERTVARLKTEMEKMQESSGRLREERAAYYAKIDRIQKELQEAYVVQNTAKINLEQCARKICAAKEAAENIRREDEELDGQITDISDNQESIAVELDTSKRLEEQLTGQIKDDQVKIDFLRKEEAKRQEEAEKLHLSCANLEQKQMFIGENIARIREELLRFEREREELKSGKESAYREMREKEEKIGEIQQTIADSAGLFADIEEEIRGAEKEREDLNGRHRSFLQKREELSRHMSELDKEIYRLTSRKEGCEEAYEKQIDFMWQEYELTYSHALELRDGNLTDLAVMKKRILDLRNEIRALGFVNVNAIEDYKNLAARYEFLKGQHDDLVEAERSLVKIIQELDEAMRRRFLDQFARISQEFNHVFRELFGGGRGTLELMEGEDVLEAGIRITAQPPGKKLQSIVQLSGGEKALTAISLLFAIQNLKPSPFCLLDEIEAALDDSNVIRFAKYLHKLTEHTQFIVITHRRGTMTAADRLYGITMQEKGVSAQVSVSLLADELKE